MGVLLSLFLGLLACCADIMGFAQQGSFTIDGPCRQYSESPSPKSSAFGRARHFRNIKVSTMTASIPPTIPKLTLNPFLKSQNSRPFLEPPTALVAGSRSNLQRAPMPSSWDPRLQAEASVLSFQPEPKGSRSTIITDLLSQIYIHLHICICVYMYICQFIRKYMCVGMQVQNR